MTNMASTLAQRLMDLLGEEVIEDAIDLTVESEGDSDTEEEPTTSDEEFIADTDESEYEEEEEEEEGEPEIVVYVPKGQKVVVISE